MKERKKLLVNSKRKLFKWKRKSKMKRQYTISPISKEELYPNFLYFCLIFLHLNFAIILQDEKAHELRQLQQKVQEVQVQIREARDESKTVTSNINHIQRKIEQLENVANQRLNNLKSFQRDTYNAVIWLRENRHLFKEEVFEPIVLLVLFFLLLVLFLAHVPPSL